MNNCDCERPDFRCGVCGKSYSTLDERNKCEMQCLKERAAKEVEAAENAKLKKQNEDEAKIKKAFCELSDSVMEYMKQYGKYPDLNEHKHSRFEFPWWFV